MSTTEDGLSGLRGPRAVDVACEVVIERSEVPAELRCTELSSCGARVVAGVAPDVGELVVLSFTLPAVDGALTFFARVREVLRRGRAVRGFRAQFLDATTRDRHALGTALARMDAPPAADAA